MQIETHPITVDKLIAARAHARWRRAAMVFALLLLVAWSIKVTVIDDTDWERIGSLASVAEDTWGKLALGASVELDTGISAYLQGEIGSAVGSSSVSAAMQSRPRPRPMRVSSRSASG